MKYSTTTFPLFEKEAKRLFKKYPSLKKDIKTLSESLEKDPSIGILLYSNIYKIRMSIASKGKGKRGGARVIYAVIEMNKNEGIIGLHYIYDKSEFDNFTDKQIKEIIKSNLDI